MIEFTELRIRGLFGEADVTIPIKDNRVVLVGYNGVGKSTVLNIFYYLISQQWSKLNEQDFDTVSVKVAGRRKWLRVERSSIRQFLHSLASRRRAISKYHLPRSAMNELYSRLAHSPPSIENYREVSDLANSIARRNRIPTKVVEEIVRDYLSVRSGQQSLFEDDELPLTEVSKFLSENLSGRILYLPTYRRIEKDLKTVFPEIEEELQRKLTNRRSDPDNSHNYIELVHFGMDDVKAKIRERLENIRGYAFGQMSNLTTLYLRDVIRDEANRYDPIDEQEITESAVSDVFTKVDSRMLNSGDREKLVSVVGKIRSGVPLQDNERYVAHYVMYLVDLGKSISKLERPITEFVSICNSYLYGKSFHFESGAYRLEVKHDSGRPVELEELSSGEKQIVSLFSHLILDDETDNYIVIDEPELSLSVDWQERFLEDISKMRTCKFIGAVTHSPFIFSNSLDAYTVELLSHTATSIPE